MADSSISITPGSGAVIDGQIPSGGDFQQTVTIGDGTNVGRIVAVTAGGLLQVAESPVRTQLSASTAVAGVTAGTTATDALLTLALVYRALASVGSSTSVNITNAKTFRIQAITVAIKNNAAAVGQAVFNLRGAAAGATTTSSALLAQITVALPATTGQADKWTWQPEGGYDIPGAATGTQNSFALSVVPTFASTAPTLWASITGYEY